ncbi:MAG TPA: hypothetical protein VML57_01730, partial [Burkholderiales bacterium]|nr:hypothetical protein [Burkholderiales bacterium]
MALDHIVWGAGTALALAPQMQGDSAAAALLLAAVHLAAGKLHGGERSRWLSAAGGVSAAYVF